MQEQSDTKAWGGYEGGGEGPEIGEGMQTNKEGRGRH